MKIFCVVSVICIVGAGSDTSEDIKQLQELTRRIEEYRKPCLKEVGLYSDTINGGYQPVNSPNLGNIFCLWACLYRKNGSIGPDGKVNEAAVRSKNPELQGSLNQIINKCETQGGGNDCQLAACLALKANFNLLE